MNTLTPHRVVITVTLTEREQVRCTCGKLLAERLHGVLDVMCPRCKANLRFQTL